MQELAPILPLILIVAVFWLLIVRPARKKQQAMNRLRTNLTVGDSILLGSGIFGVVRGLDEEGKGMRVEIAPDVVVRVHKDAVVSVEAPQTTPESEERPPRTEQEG